MTNLKQDVGSAEAVSRADYHNLLMASNDIDRALREYQAKEEAEALKGEWFNRNNDGTWATVDFAYCSHCKQPIIHKHTAPLWSFCPNCGADMRGGHHDHQQD